MIHVEEFSDRLLFGHPEFLQTRFATKHLCTDYLNVSRPNVDPTIVTALLITQCLQRDFVCRIGKYAELPNLLHVGYEEAQRLCGEDDEFSAIESVITWAYEQSDDALKVIHIRDWHDETDPSQQQHLRQFGAHCLQNTYGAEFVFKAEPCSPKDVRIVNSTSLNDFKTDDLAETLAAYSESKVRVGIMGVWTEAKILFLCYELMSRYPNFEIVVCSALTASSSRSHHFIALDQLQRILGIRVISSVGEFVEFLSTNDNMLHLGAPLRGELPTVKIEGGSNLDATDLNLIRTLFREARSVYLRPLDGGFSGNLVCGVESIDLHGHREASHVVKVGSRGLIAKEREAFERVESVLGNSAPQIAGFRDVGQRGGIKYRYAAMGSGLSTSFQKLYMQGLCSEKIDRYLTVVFRDQLGRLYEAASRDPINLLKYYSFDSRYAQSVRQRVESLGISGTGLSEITVCNCEVPNVCEFYEREIDLLLPRANGHCYQAYIHGDLNGANIVVDRQENVWLIDFFHTHRGHVIRDLVKLENDILYIFTRVMSDDDLRCAMKLSDILLSYEDLGTQLSAVSSSELPHPEFQRAYRTIQLLRSFYPELIREDRNILQLQIAQLRYAVHSLSFDECSRRQKLWALYTAGKLSRIVRDSIMRNAPLRIDWIPLEAPHEGRIGITILPGRQDHGRSLEHDLTRLSEAGISAILVLISDRELREYGVGALLDEYRTAGIEVLRLHVVDQSVPTVEEAQRAVTWLESHVSSGAIVAIHCVGGLGRSGTLAACFLTGRRFSAENAISYVRTYRSKRAVETRLQEDFVKDFARRK